MRDGAPVIGDEQQVNSGVLWGLSPPKMMADKRGVTREDRKHATRKTSGGGLPYKHLNKHVMSVVAALVAVSTLGMGAVAMANPADTDQISQQSTQTLVAPSDQTNQTTGSDQTTDSDQTTGPDQSATDTTNQSDATDQSVTDDAQSDQSAQNDASDTSSENEGTNTGDSNETTDDSGLTSDNDAVAADTQDTDADQAFFDEHTIKDGVTPSSTTINLFDYSDRVAVPGSGGDNQPDGLINKGHALKFLAKTYTPDKPESSQDFGKANMWTGPRTVVTSGEDEKDLRRTGIVGKNLGSDGYPQLTGLENDSAMFRKTNKGATWDSKESLAYLFDASIQHEGKQSYTGVGNLLQIDDNGYYYYDSSKNFASYDQESNRFKLYDSGAVNGGAIVSSPNNNSQFFPFETASKVFNAKTNDDGTLQSKGLNAGNQSLNHYFGLTMSTRFTTQDKGHVKSPNGDRQEMEYKFSGDDDVWIYIDDVLVADLGGIHDALGADINFATGKITFGNMNAKETANQPLLSPYNDSTSITIYDAFKAAGQEDSVQWQKSEDGKTKIFADNGYHTIRVFYLERGNQASNLRMSFNLVNVPESQIVKVDQSGNPMAGVKFELYGTDDKYNIDENKLVGQGKTDPNGELILTDPTLHLPISFDQIYSRGSDKNGGYLHYVLREVNAPDGYRRAENVKLKYNPPINNSSSQGEFGGYVVSDQDDMWSTGAYAQAGVLVTAPSSIYKLANTADPNTPGEPITNPENGILFAVVLKYKEKEGANPPQSLDDLAKGEWQIVTGDSLHGYKYLDANSPADIAKAIKEDSGSTTYRFMPTTNALQATIEELPGDISTYYNLLAAQADPNYIQKVKYTVAYYYLDAKSFTDATADNTHRLFIEGTGNDQKWERSFSVNLKVPNIKNRLFVQKTDENWEPLTNTSEKFTATFKLYEEDAVEEVNGKLTVKSGAQAYDEATTTKDLSVSDLNDNKDKVLMHSAALFPTSTKVLKIGTYYLQESKVYNGYQKTDKLTKIIVNENGVYADAGEKDDEFRVRKGVGSLVRTMVEYASPDQVNHTLRDIRATLQTKPSNEDPSFSTGWKDEDGSVLNLTYDTENAVLQYRPIRMGSSAGDFKNVTLENDEGWSNLEIQQLYEDSTLGVKNDFKTDLTKPVTRVLDPLFSGTTTVMVANSLTDDRYYETTLDVRKIVSGGQWPKDKIFTFEIKAESVTGWQEDYGKVAPGTKPMDLSSKVLMLPSGNGVSCDREQRTCWVTVSAPGDSGNKQTASFGILRFPYEMFKVGDKWYHMDFTYSIREITPSENDAIKGMTYSKAQYTYTVKNTGRRYKETIPKWSVAADESLTRIVSDTGSTVNTPVAPEAREDDASGKEASVYVAEFTNSFEEPVSSLPFTGGATGRQWLLWGLVLAGASLLAWLAYNEWRKRGGWSNLLV